MRFLKTFEDANDDELDKIQKRMDYYMRRDMIKTLSRTGVWTKKDLEAKPFSEIKKLYYQLDDQQKFDL